MRKRDRIFICGDTGVFEKRGPECPNYENHEPMPTGYVEFDEWAKVKNRTHKNIKCPGCGFYRLWIPRNVKVKSGFDAARGGG